jgi:Leucine-rich repeat (LRR) protein
MYRSLAKFVLLLAAAAVTWSSFFLDAHARSAHEASASCIERERDALLAFKHGLYDIDDYLVSWQHESQNCCQWAGITCRSTTGHVIQLDLHGRYYLDGQISPSLLSLEQIEYLNLNNTGLTGPNGGVPKFLGSLKNLRHLDLSSIPFNGTVPPQLGNLSRLEYLDLSGSAMYSTDISWLTHLPLVVYLDMSGMNLSSIAAGWSLVVNNLPSLEYLGLASCSLSGANQFLEHQNLTKLHHLDLSYNYFGHPVASAWFWNVTSIKYIDISETSLHGPFPNALGNMTSLQHLFFSCSLDFDYGVTTCNKATMTVDMRNLCDLEELVLDGSLSSGNITKFLENLPQCPSNRFKYLEFEEQQYEWNNGSWIGSVK